MNLVILYMIVCICLYVGTISYCPLPSLNIHCLLCPSHGAGTGDTDTQAHSHVQSVRMMVTDALNALINRGFCRKPMSPAGTGCVSRSFLEGWVFDISGGCFGELAAARLPLSLGPVFTVFPWRKTYIASAWCLLSSLHRNHSVHGCSWPKLPGLTSTSPLPHLPAALNTWWMGTDLKCPDLSPLSRIIQRHTVSQSFHQD